MSRQAVDIKVRLNNRVNKLDPNGCWIWLTGRDKDGYGQILYNKKMQKGHRVAYQVFVGPIPKGLLVLHKCDNPPCCNPEHLFLGTAQDNVDDMYKKGRERDSSGENNNLSKLTKKEVLEIRAKYIPCKKGIKRNNCYGLAKLAEDYGVTDKNIWLIVKNINWRHV